MTISIAESTVLSRVAAIAGELKHAEGPLLPILHAVQAEFGFVPEEAKPLIAEALNLSRAEVHGVASFYHDFRSHPAGRHVLRLCRAEACQAMGGDDVAERIKAALGLDWHQTTPDGRVTLEPVFCLGLCATAPAAMLDGAVHGRIDADSAIELLAEAGR